MRSIPVDTSSMRAMVMAVGRAEERVNPDDPRSGTRDKVTADGELVWRLQCYITVEDGEVDDPDAVRGELLDVTVVGNKPDVRPGDQADLEGLTARPWSMNGRSGVSFSARAVTKAGTSANGKRPGNIAPPVPAGGPS